MSQYNVIYKLLFVLLLSSGFSYGQQNIVPLSNALCSTPRIGEFNTSGWGLFWSNNFYSQSQLLSDSNLSNFILGSNSINSIPEDPNNLTLGNRISLINLNDIINDISAPPGSLTQDMFINSQIIKVGGNYNEDNLILPGCEEVKRVYEITPDNAFLNLRYIAVVSNVSAQTNISEFVKFTIKVEYDDGTFLNLPPSLASQLITNITPFQNSYDYLFNLKKVYRRIIAIDLKSYGIDFCKHPVVSYSLMVSDSNSQNNHNSAYAYLAGSCISATQDFINSGTSKDCVDAYRILNLENQFSNNLQPGDIVTWKLFNQQTGITEILTNTYNYTFASSGIYHITLSIQKVNSECEFIIEKTYNIFNCEDSAGNNPPDEGPTDTTVTQTCRDCSSFDLLKNQKYIVSGWTKLMNTSNANNYLPIIAQNYTNVFIGVSYLDSNGAIIGSAELQFAPSGEIIDGWQKIQNEITLPNTISEIKISLVNNNGSDVSAFFDDIRVHPFNGNLKSFVYDQATQKLMAELDENNYSTFYEYDNEGGLIRVKKETEKGIFTIQETRSSTKKNF